MATQAQAKNWITSHKGKSVNPDKVYGAQCPTRGSYLSMADGTYKLVEDVRVGDKVFNHDRSSVNKVTSVVEKLADVNELKTQAGTLRVSSDHPFLALKRRKYISLVNRTLTFEPTYKLSKKDLVAVPVRDRKDYAKLTDDELRWLGFWLGDGSKSFRYEGSKIARLYITVGVDRKYKFVESLNVSLRMVQHSNGRARQYHLINKEHPELARLITSFTGKELPLIFSANEYAHIVAGYLEADGCRKRESETTATSTDKNLLLAIQYACLLLGYHATIRLLPRAKLPIINGKQVLSAKPIYKISVNFEPKRNQFRHFQGALCANVISNSEAGQDSIYVIAVDGDCTYIVDNHASHNCMDLIVQYGLDLFNHRFTGNAKALWTQKLPSGWKRLSNTPSLVPQAGDIVVWKPASWNGNYGHTGIATGKGTTKSFQSLDQNWFNASSHGSPAAYVTHGYVGTYAIYGVLRPKWTTPPAPKPVDPCASVKKDLADTKAKLTKANSANAAKDKALKRANTELTDAQDALRKAQNQLKAAPTVEDLHELQNKNQSLAGRLSVVSDNLEEAKRKIQALQTGTANKLVELYQAVIDLIKKILRR